MYFGSDAQPIEGLVDVAGIRVYFGELISIQFKIFLLLSCEP